jgi:hypothetical protein
LGSDNDGSILAAVIWMFIISLLLFWIPGIGGLIAGIVGGKKAGGVLSAIFAVFLPAMLFGSALAIMSTSLTGIPLIGVVAAAGGFFLAASYVGPMLIGAIIGGILA